MLKKTLLPLFRSSKTPVTDPRFCGLLFFVLAIAACGVSAQPQPGEFEQERAALVQTLTKPVFGRTPVRSIRVLEAVQAVPRHEFVPTDLQAHAYKDQPLPIGHQQTISQPYIVAIMTEALQLQPTDSVLEIGTGSGYQAAVLALLVEQVYTIEIVPELGRNAKTKLGELGYDNVVVRIGDGYKGWPDHAPFDCIIVTAAPDHVPQPLIDQLKVGGRMIIPVGPERDTQELLLITRTEDGQISEDRIELVRFVPMTGEAQER